MTHDAYARWINRRRHVYQPSQIRLAAHDLGWDGPQALECCKSSCRCRVCQLADAETNAILAGSGAAL